MNFLTKLILLSSLTALTSAHAVDGDDTHDHDAHAPAFEPIDQADDDGAEPHSDHEHEEGHSHDDDDHESEHPEHESEDDDHDHDGHDDEKTVVELDRDQLSLAGITVKELDARKVDLELYAPGEIKANGYTSYIVSPRTDSVVLRRHVTLGEHIEAGQPLVTLFSEAVTEAQASYQLSAAELQRVRRLGKQAVGEKRFIEAETSFESAQGRLIAYGMSRDAIDAIDASGPDDLGEYTLTAAIGGVVLSDDFRQGQRVEAGDALMELADEDELWVEARLSSGNRMHLDVGQAAEVRVAGERFPAVIAQEAHTIDPETRTRVVRLLVRNQSHRLHPGLFVDVYFTFKTSRPVLAVPEAALMRREDGDWTVFVESAPGQFTATEVRLGRALGSLREISGIPAGSRVVTSGAFFVASQAAKGGFDPHNH